MLLYCNVFLLLFLDNILWEFIYVCNYFDHIYPSHPQNHSPPSPKVMFFCFLITPECILCGPFNSWMEGCGLPTTTKYLLIYRYKARTAASKGCLFFEWNCRSQDIWGFWALGEAGEITLLTGAGYITITHTVAYNCPRLQFQGI